MWPPGPASLQPGVSAALGGVAPLSPAAEVPHSSTEHSREDPRAVAVLPVQKEGATHYLPVGRVHAVKAEAHYTTVFDGTTRFFCGLSITDVEGRLDQSRFVRVHRSHIVAVDRITSLKKSGDGGVAQLDSSTPYSLPVSRRKLPELRAILDARA
jgi:DNA-binding LytR/AlgR family response regulator